jgi:hypothetical protein
MFDVARALAPFLIYESTQPLARVELFEEGGYPARFLRGQAADDDAAQRREEDGPWAR